MHLKINKDTKVCISVSSNPSNFGTMFHNYLYSKLNLNFVYKGCQTEDIQAVIIGLKALKFRGCSVSMPFKRECIKYLDKLEKSAATIDAVNTIVNDNGFLTGYNTDYIAVEKLIDKHKIDKQIPFVLQGSGGMANAVIGAFFDKEFRNGYILARNTETASKLANKDNYQYIKDITELNIKPKLLINVTPKGMQGKFANELSFPATYVKQADIIFDVVAYPSETPLIKTALLQNKKIISGAEVIVLQAVEQFKLYTGILPPDALIKEATDYTLSNMMK